MSKSVPETVEGKPVPNPFRAEPFSECFLHNLIICTVALEVSKTEEDSVKASLCERWAQVFSLYGHIMEIMDPSRTMTRGVCIQTRLSELLRNLSIASWILKQNINDILVQNVNEGHSLSI